MNKREFVEAVHEETGVSVEIVTEVVNIYEKNLLSSKDSQRTVSMVCEKCKLASEEAEKLVQACERVLKSELIRKLKHPFGK